MFSVYIWLYTFFVVIAWWFFIVTKVHVYKFKNFSNYIGKVVPLIAIFMLILTIVGYIIIFTSDIWNSTYKIDFTNDTKVIEY